MLVKKCLTIRNSRIKKTPWKKKNMSLPDCNSIIPNNYVKINIVISSTSIKCIILQMFRVSFIRVTGERYDCILLRNDS